MKNIDQLTRRGEDTLSIINCKTKVFGVVIAMLLLLYATVLSCIFFMPKTASVVQAETGDVAEVSYIGEDNETEIVDSYNTFSAAWNAALAKSTATVKLLADVTAGGVLTVASGKNITLDLNDKVLNLGGAYGNARNIQINGGTFTLTDSADTKTVHSVTSAVTNTSIEITGGVITGGYAVEYGGGVCLSSGTFNMIGGAISGNKPYSGKSGGGVYVDSGVFNMSGGTISHNTASSWSGGGVYMTGGTFTMSGNAEISNNNGYGGGGVSVGSKYVNKVYVGSTFVMQGGIISENTANGNGGGVHVNTNSTFKMSGGEISGNTSNYGGGGVRADQCTFELSGSPVIQNNTDKDGNKNNVYLNHADADYAQQKVKITGSLSDGARIGVNLNSAYKGTITELKGQKFTGVFTDGYSSHEHGSSDPTTCFFSDNDDYYIGFDFDGNEVAVRDNAVKYEVEIDDETKEERIYSTFKEAWLATKAATGPVTLTLLKDVTIGAGSTSLGGAITTNVTLDLNGKVLNLNGNGAINSQYNSSVKLSVGSGGTLTLIDSEPTTVNKVTSAVTNAEVEILGGVITGGCGGSNGGGGGVNVSGGTFNMNGGAIAGNTTSQNGGGVYLAGGTFNMNRGTISHNTATGSYSYGGGVYIQSGCKFYMSGTAEISNNYSKGSGGGVCLSGTETSFEMSGGTICKNMSDASYYSGGGVYVNTGTFTMSAGKIAENTAKAGGGGVSLNGNANFNMSDTAEIYKNTANDGGGVHIYSGTFNMTGGTISGNEAKNNGTGGGVHLYNGNSIFKFEAGKITGNTAAYGGGVSNSGSFEMSGTAEISDNKAVVYNNLYGTGGGVHQQGNSAVFTMTGGTISDNTARRYGGGAYISAGQFNVSGSPKISDNYLHDDNEQKTNISSNVFLTLDTDSNVKVKINVAGELNSDASIGIAIDGQDFNGGLGVFTIGFGEKGGSVDTSVFVSDVDYYVILEDNECIVTDVLPFILKSATVDSVIGSYTAGDKTVKVKINRTLEKIETGEEINDKIDYTVKVDPLHAGQSVAVGFTYKYGDKSESLTAYIPTVAKKKVRISWYYKGETTSATAQKDYNGIDRRSEVEARYEGISGTTVYVSGSELKMTYNGAATMSYTEFKNAGTYVFSLDVTELGDYEFSNNSLTFTIDKIGINLTDETAYNWVLRSDRSELRTGNIYIYTVDGNPQYFYNEQSDLDLYETKYVTRSIVRFRNMTISIVLNGVDISRTSVKYENCDQKDVGPHISYAYLTLLDSVNYYYVGGNIDQSRGMTIQIGADGKTATITKNWYIVNISNGLLSQEQLTYGQEYDIPDWTYGDDVTISAPRLEHGDEGAYQSIYPFGASDNKVMFELYRRDIGSTGAFTKIGDKFNRAAFSNYINKSMPAGEYSLEVSVVAVSLASSNHTHWWDGEAETGSKLYFEEFTQEYTFTVAKAALGYSVDDGIKDKTYTYYYDGKLHLYKDDKITVTTTGAPTRTGVWKDKYDVYYDGAEVTLTYNLNRWDNSIYRTEKELNDFTDDDSLRPIAVDKYKIYYRAELKNYVTYGGEYSFTVVIEKAQFDLSVIKFDNGSFVYDEEEHSIFVTGAPDFIKVEYVGNGKTEIGTYTVTAKLSLDGDNYKLVGETERTATLTILAKTLEVVKDEESGKVWVGVDNDKGFEPNIELNVVELPEYKNSNIEEDIAAAYEITLKKDNQTVTPDGGITISLLIPEDLRGEKFKILQVTGNSVKPVSYVAIGDYAIFTADSLSPFVFVKEAEAVVTPPDNPVTTNPAATATNENNMWWIWIVVGVIAVLIIILLLVLIFRKKNSKETLPAPPIETAPATSDAIAMANKMAEAAAIVAEAAAIVAEAKRNATQNNNADNGGNADGVKVETAPEKLAASTPKPELAPAHTPTPELAPAPEPEPVAEQPVDDDVTPEVDEDDAEVPSDDGFAGAFEASSSETVTYSQSVLSKLISSTDVVKNRYSELKNYLLSYKKARANMSRARESYYIGRNCYARMAVRGKTLCVYLALDPQKYAGSKYNVEDVLGVKSYADTPCLIRIKSERALKYAKELIDELMTEIGAEKCDRTPSNYVELFKSIEMLQKKKLISCSGNKKKK